MIHPGAIAQVAEWPELPYDAWAPTLDTLHMKLQVIGKIRLTLTRREPQWANVPLYLTARGLGTSPIPYRNQSFEVEFDFLDHLLMVRTADGSTRSLPLVSQSVAQFYGAWRGSNQKDVVGDALKRRFYYPLDPSRPDIPDVPGKLIDYSHETRSQHP